MASEKFAISKGIVWSVLSILVSALVSVSWVHLNYRLNSNTICNTRQDKQIVNNQVAIEKTLGEVHVQGMTLKMIVDKIDK